MADTTTRAYTLKLQGDRLALWGNHVVFNRGVQRWGEWLLNLRGGLPASLADDKELLTVPASEVTKTAKERATAINPAAIRQEADFRTASDTAVRAEVASRRKRITETAIRKELLAARQSELRLTLALSWLSPETPVALVPAAAIVAGAADSDREAKVLSRFRQIVKQKKVADVAGWLADCDAPLRAAIRPDAVWVDRSACFRGMPESERPVEEDAAKHLFVLFGSAKEYFATSAAGEAEEKNYSTTAGNWISKNWGEGAKSDDAKILRILAKLVMIDRLSVVGVSGSKALAKMLSKCGGDTGGDFRSLCGIIGWRGKPNKTRKALEKLVAAPRVTAEHWDRFKNACDEERRLRKASKGQSVPPWAGAMKTALPDAIGLPFNPGVGRSHHFEYATMLAFAVRRISQIHTKAKQAEAERRSFAPEQAQMALVPLAARRWLESYVESRSLASGAEDGYQLRRRALSGWPEVVAAWDACDTVEDRVAAVRELQADWDKPGDTQLFEALAIDEALCVWRAEAGRGVASMLTAFVRASVADQNAIRFKVPAYRHPDPLRSPTFIGFGNSQWSISYSAQAEASNRQKLLDKADESAKAAARAEEAIGKEAVLQDVILDLWTDKKMQPTKFRWQSRRLMTDLALHSIQELRGVRVTRASRLGRAGAQPGPVIVDGITDDAPWNGRLQAPRRELEDLARVLDAKGLPYDDESKWPAKVRARLRHLGWFLTHSAKLTPSGPWLNYVAKELPNGWQWPKGRDGHYLFREDNKARMGRAKLILSRLPGLRVLAVDLGLRTSAAVAVWQVVAKGELEEAKKASDSIQEDKLFCFVRRGQRNELFRRIGPDAWARLDRQFLIRLDGEKAAARPATASEWESMQRFLAWLGCGAESAQAKLPAVDRLHHDAERQCRLGLRRLAGLARVAFLLAATERPIMGGRMASLNPEDQIQAAQDAVAIWHGLASSEDFVDTRLRTLWKTHVGKAAPLATRLTKKQLQEVRESLRPAAERLHGNASLSRELAALWKERSDEWAKHLRWLRDCVVPRFNKRTHGERVRAARDVGGLSLDRIATIRGVYQVMRAYASRPEPTNLRAGVERLEQEASRKLRPEFGRRMLAKMERLRENRVKQIASRIVEAALGVGSEDRLHWERGRKRPTTAIAGPRFSPCHAVVIENLANYRPDEKRTRRENRGLMSWAARAIGKYLAEGCELHGMYLREVSPSYTSRQDSRTGCPGMRCNDVPVRELKNAEGWLGRLVLRAEEAVKDGKATPRQELLVKMAEAVRGQQITSGTVRIIAPGGQLFVAADAVSPSANGLHADMNAAANIGLVALLDPDWPAAWWRVPCKTATGEVDDTKVGGSEAIPLSEPLLDPGKETGRGIVNAWSDPKDSPVGRRYWTDSKRYWRDVERRVVEVLLSWNRDGRRHRPGALPF